MGAYWQTDSTNSYIDKNHWVYDGIEKDADYDLINERTLQELRLISSAMVKNNFFSHGIILAYINAILGGNIDIKVSYPIQSIEDEINYHLKDVLKRTDIHREVSFKRLCEQIVSGACIKGDILINFVGREDEKIDFYIELISASRIDTPDEFLTNKLIRSGVEYLSNGEIKGYWVRKLFPNPNDLQSRLYRNTKDNYSFVDKYKVLKSGEKKLVSYLFKAATLEECDQSRQVPVLTPLMGLVRYISQYFEALLISIRVSACFVGIFISKDPIETKTNLESNVDSTFKPVKINPGCLMMTDKDGSVQFASPSAPIQNIDPFLKRVCMFMGMTIRLPYPYLFLDMESVNYSSYRGATIEAKNTAGRWHVPLTWFSEWYIWEILKGFKYKGVVNFSLKNVSLLVNFPEFKALDPEKEARGNKIELQNGTTSPQRLCAEKGDDYNQVMKDKEEHLKWESEIQAKVLAYRIELETLYKVVFPENQEPIDRKTPMRAGEENPNDLDEEIAKERRKDDGNW